MLGDRSKCTERYSQQEYCPGVVGRVSFQVTFRQEKVKSASSMRARPTERDLLVSTPTAAGCSHRDRLGTVLADRLGIQSPSDLESDVDQWKVNNEPGTMSLAKTEAPSWCADR